MTDLTHRVTWREKFRTLLQLGFTNQGTHIRTLKDSPSRQRSRRAAFVRRNRELIETYGYNLPRRVRRRIAWDGATVPSVGRWAGKREG